MPGDSLNINNKAAAIQNTYDAIVIGSGISGGWAAKELTEKGLKVLLLERGRPLDHIKITQRQHTARGTFHTMGVRRCSIKKKITRLFQEIGQCMALRRRKAR